MKKESPDAPTSGPSDQSRESKHTTPRDRYTRDGKSLNPTFALEVMRAVGNTSLSSVARLVLIAELDHVNALKNPDVPVAWPGQEELMRIAGCKTRETIERATAEIERAGFHRRAYHTGDGTLTADKWSASRRQHGRAYILNLDRLVTLANCKNRVGFSDTAGDGCRVGLSGEAVSDFSDEPCRMFRESRVGLSDTTELTLPNSPTELIVTDTRAREDNADKSIPSPEPASKASTDRVVPALSENDPRADLLMQHTPPIPPFWSEPKPRFSIAQAQANAPEKACANCGRAFKTRIDAEMCRSCHATRA